MPPAETEFMKKWKELRAWEIRRSTRTETNITISVHLSFYLFQKPETDSVIYDYLGGWFPPSPLLPGQNSCTASYHPQGDRQQIPYLIFGIVHLNLPPPPSFAWWEWAKKAETQAIRKLVLDIFKTSSLILAWRLQSEREEVHLLLYLSTTFHRATLGSKYYIK